MLLLVTSFLLLVVLFVCSLTLAFFFGMFCHTSSSCFVSFRLCAVYGTDYPLIGSNWIEMTEALKLAGFITDNQARSHLLLPLALLLPLFPRPFSLFLPLSTQVLIFCLHTQRKYLNEIFPYNPLLFDFALKRTVQSQKGNHPCSLLSFFPSPFSLLVHPSPLCYPTFVSFFFCSLSVSAGRHFSASIFTNNPLSISKPTTATAATTETTAATSSAKTAATATATPQQQQMPSH